MSRWLATRSTMMNSHSQLTRNWKTIGHACNYSSEREKWERNHQCDTREIIWKKEECWLRASCTSTHLVWPSPPHFSPFFFKIFNMRESDDVNLKGVQYQSTSFLIFLSKLRIISSVGFFFNSYEIYYLHSNGYYKHDYIVYYF